MATRARPFLPGILALLLLLPTDTSAASGSEAFEEGLAAYRADHLEKALERFEAAREAGLDQPALHHNLGTVYYRLGRYPEARRAFQRLLEDPGSTALAHYNLGLVA
ncbi:MAG: tetratricopeptide repeat protein, partial [Thiohalorhabdus sp.]|uniref:tetratricopeptide repeat protein n=1 Tax=Thiohalorhabdus sp. TaxID=3094134 RepID=UPI003980690E